MRANEIKQHLTRRPFQPIRVYVSDGSSYDVHHPEMALLTLNELIIALGDGSEELPERAVYCDPLHITRIEPIPRRRRTGRRER